MTRHEKFHSKTSAKVRDMSDVSKRSKKSLFLAKEYAPLGLNKLKHSASKASSVSSHIAYAQKVQKPNQDNEKSHSISKACDSKLDLP